MFQSWTWKDSINRKRPLIPRILCDQVKTPRAASEARLRRCPYKSQLHPRNCQPTQQWADWSSRHRSILLNLRNPEIALPRHKDHNSTHSAIFPLLKWRLRETARHTTLRTKSREIPLLSCNRDLWLRINLTGLLLHLSSHQQLKIIVPSISRENLLSGEHQRQDRLHPKRRCPTLKFRT